MPQHDKQAQLKVLLDKLADENNKANSWLNDTIGDAKRQHAYDLIEAIRDFNRAIFEHDLVDVYQEYLDAKAETE